MMDEPRFGSSEYSEEAEELFALYVTRREAGERVDFEAYCAEHEARADELYGLHADWDNVASLLRRVEARRRAATPEPEPTPGPEVVPEPAAESAPEPAPEAELAIPAPLRRESPRWKLLSGFGLLLALAAGGLAVSLSRNNGVLAREKSVLTEEKRELISESEALERRRVGLVGELESARGRLEATRGELSSAREELAAEREALAAERLATERARLGERHATRNLLWVIARLELEAAARRRAERALELAGPHALVPLGPDPESGLWLFADRRTGEVPERDENGAWLPTEDSALLFRLVPGAPDEDPAVPPFFIATSAPTEAHRARAGVEEELAELGYSRASLAQARLAGTAGQPRLPVVAAE